jgi:hypothetical protein
LQLAGLLITFIASVKRLAATILLFALAAFLIEAVTLRATCDKQVSRSTCAVMTGMDQCCKHKPAQDKKTPGPQDKTSAKDCADCPLCSTTIAKDPITFSSPAPINVTEYAVMLNNDLSDYHSRQWKPPNDVS